MDRRVEVFRREAARIGRGGTGRRYPASARAMAVEYARAQIAKGVTVAAIAAELGVPGQTLTYWIDLPPAWRTPRIARQCAGVFDEEEEQQAGKASPTVVHA